MIDWIRPSAAEQRLIPSAGIRGPVPVLISIMVFVMVIVAAAGLALANSAGVIGKGISNRYTIQVADGQSKAEEVVAAVQRAPGITRIAPVPPNELKSTLQRWLGPDAERADLPLPTIIDVDLAEGANPETVSRAVEKAVPGARFLAHKDTLSPLFAALTGLGWLAFALVLLIASASAAAVVLAAKGALDTHRATVEVMHGLGATDRQIARLFQRQIAVDALIGALAGTAAAAALLLLFVGASAFATTLSGRPPLGWVDAALLSLIPIMSVTLATLVARRAVLGALRERL